MPSLIDDPPAPTHRGPAHAACVGTLASDRSSPVSADQDTADPPDTGQLAVDLIVTVTVIASIAWLLSNVDGD